MSPEEWADKLRSLIEEVEDDLTRNDWRDYWSVESHMPGSICLKHYIEGFEVRDDRIYL